MNVFAVSSALIIYFISATPALAASNLSIISAGESSYVLQGTEVDGAAAIEGTIIYDAAAYGNPRVELGPLAAGAMMAVNPNTPGMIRLALIRTAPMSGSGTIVSIAFERKGDQAGKANLANIKLISLDGKTLPVSVQAATAFDPSSAPVTASSVQDASTRQAASVGTGVAGQTQHVPQQPIGVIAIPKKQDEESKRPEDARIQKELSGQPVRRTSSEEPSRAAKRSDDVPQTASRKIYSQKSVLERFSEFKGKPAVKDYLALFEQEGMIGFRQDPPVVLADGKNRVRVSFISSTPTRTTSDIAVIGATLLSLKKDQDYTNTFILELLPAKGELRASVSVPQENVLMVFPLTLAPRVSTDISTKVGSDEAAFKFFLTERGTREFPKFDLNGDGKRDYIDDYIYTANYVVDRLRTAATGTKK